VVVVVVVDDGGVVCVVVVALVVEVKAVVVCAGALEQERAVTRDRTRIRLPSVIKSRFFIVSPPYGISSDYIVRAVKNTLGFSGTLMVVKRLTTHAFRRMGEFRYGSQAYRGS